MAHINIDLNAIPEPEPHPTGETLLQVTGVEVKDTKPKEGETESSGQYINLKIRVPGSENKTPIYEMLSLKEEGLWKLVQAYKVMVLGKPRNEKGVHFPVDWRPEDFLEREFYDEIVNEEYPKGSGNFKSKLAGKYKPAGK